MFATIAYRGHHIQVRTERNHEEVKARIQHQDGGFHLVQVRSLRGAMSAISRHISAAKGALA
jgi:hypothetical protein